MVERKSSRRWMAAGALALCIAASLTSARAHAQVSGTAAPKPGVSSPATASKQLSVARSIMARTRYCALITLGNDGHASARTVDPLAPDSGFVVRFATNPKSRKVGELQRNPRVTLYYFDPKTLSYVSLYGTARRVTEASEKATSWKAEWTPFYKNRDDGVALFAVRPERIEVVSVSEGVSGDTITWAPPTIRRFPIPTKPRS